LLDGLPMTSRTYVVSIALALAAASPAFADPPVAEPAWPWTPSDPSSYRLEVVAIDASTVAVLALGHDSTLVVGLAIATYALGSPILHLVHQRPGNALGSFALRVALPVGGATLGYLLSNGSSGSGDIPSWVGGAALGLVAGVVGASAIDIGVLAKGEDAPRLAPAITPTLHGGMTFGLGGSF
jgi:hypothetical protein